MVIVTMLNELNEQCQQDKNISKCNLFLLLNKSEVPQELWTKLNAKQLKPLTQSPRGGVMV